MLRVSVASLIAVPLMATVGFAAPEIGDYLGTTVEEVSATMESSGYAVTYVDFDTEIIDVEFSIGDEVYDLDVDPETGLVIDVESDEDGDGDAGGGDF